MLDGHSSKVEPFARDLGDLLMLVARNGAKFALERSKNAVDSKCSFVIPFCVATMCVNFASLEYLSIVLHGRIVKEAFVRSKSETVKPTISPMS